MTKKTTIILSAFFVLLLALIFWYLAPGIRANLTSCTLEAMQCADGSYVGRTGPNCEFSACPGGDPMSPSIGESPPATITPPSGGGGSDEEIFCTMDAKLCPDGSYVGRVPPNCAFVACPGN